MATVEWLKCSECLEGEGKPAPQMASRILASGGLPATCHLLAPQSRRPWGDTPAGPPGLGAARMWLGGEDDGKWRLVLRM